MSKRVPKVLMIGWEFPPIINGGLGVACHDLCSAMSDLADITMVVPRSSRTFKMKNMNLVGINNVDEEFLQKVLMEKPAPLPFELKEVMADLDPYYHTVLYDDDWKGEDQLTLEQGTVAMKRLRNRLQINDLYGGDVVRNVMEFSEITTGLANNMDFDIIHAHDWMTMLAGIRIKYLTGKPLVVHIHSLEVDRGGTGCKGWVYELEKKGMEYADLVMPVSNFTASNIEQYYGISRSKIKVVHNGTRPVHAYRSKRSFNEKTVLFVGRLTRQKGPEIFLDIAARVLQKDPDVRFVMAGVGDYFRSVLEKSSYQGIGNRFHLTGFLNHDQLSYLFSVSDVYCMPSVSEPFGLSALEAAQFGIPCVISKQSGVAEVLSGTLKFDHWDVHKAADCIISLLHDKVLRKKVVRDAAKSLKHISWENTARKVLDAYSESGLLKN